MRTKKIAGRAFIFLRFELIPQTKRSGVARDLVSFSYPRIFRFELIPSGSCFVRDSPNPGFLCQVVIETPFSSPLSGGLIGFFCMIFIANWDKGKSFCRTRVFYAILFFYNGALLLILICKRNLHAS